MAEPEHPRVIAAMPAYNEERYIGTLVLEARKYADEVIVVDDGSTDNTAEIAGLAGATVVRHPQNKGKGAAIQSLLAEARKREPDVLVFLDADFQHNPDEIPRLVKAVLDGYDLVVGSRELVRKSIPFYRRVGQTVLRQSTRTLARNRISDSESGFRAFSRRAVNELKLSQQGFAIESEMIAAAEEKRLRVTEVPITVKYTKDSSTLHPFRHGLGVLAQIIAMISERRPLYFFGLVGGISVVAGVIAGVRTLRLFAASGIMPVGTVMLSVLLLIIGVFSIFTGLMLRVLAKRKG